MARTLIRDRELPEYILNGMLPRGLLLSIHSLTRAAREAFRRFRLKTELVYEVAETEGTYSPPGLRQTYAIGRNGNGLFSSSLAVSSQSILKPEARCELRRVPCIW